MRSQIGDHIGNRLMCLRKRRLGIVSSGVRPVTWIASLYSPSRQLGQILLIAPYGRLRREKPAQIGQIMGAGKVDAQEDEHCLQRFFRGLLGEPTALPRHAVRLAVDESRHS